MKINPILKRETVFMIRRNKIKYTFVMILFVFISLMMIYNIKLADSNVDIFIEVFKGLNIVII